MNSQVKTVDLGAPRNVRVPAPSEPIYPIGVAARISKIPISIIREYESWGLICPHISPTGRRFFSDVDIANMIHLRSLQKDYHLSLAGLRFLAGSLPCWALKPCKPSERKKCAAAKSNGVPCWVTQDTPCQPDREKCRACSCYQSVASLGKFKELLAIVFS